MQPIPVFPRSRRLLSILALIAIVIAVGVSQITLSDVATDRSTSRLEKALPDPATDILASTAKGEQTVVLAGGCFWGVEGVFEHVKGVSDVVSGYAGGSAATAHYPIVSLGQTNHAESVKITYDPAQISYAQLLKIYFSVAHDPTQLNRQGPDSGTQYRSAIFFANSEQKRVAQTYIDQLNQAQTFRESIVTQLTPLNEFYPAEEHHQNFITHHPNHPYVVVHDLPKLKQLEAQFSDQYKNQAS
ncbi:peptide-methionine (S)-S-oxide reductase MsrA [Leptolyngbya sp. FACHB-36]|uniref:peptide-methionine (S)-S-oxide reductase MsrA n=1 Tax=Leptolyngbya sp. FACHB-36 TaxID=2692808 RepID=UPI00168064DC|nr:peptide-methionine (S)-S-oxide reductase MsrA [Leptolyngbya sp. FACHB-36]MBD2021274.1 peptide-methionine (S)-S-oxide reductase MsrA [Leptolyngbya sp. FACHB-36]